MYMLVDHTHYGEGYDQDMTRVKKGGVGDVSNKRRNMRQTVNYEGLLGM